MIRVPYDNIISKIKENTDLSMTDINVKVNKIVNPRIEKEKHFYNAKHSNLEKLGLKPLKLNEDIVIDIAKYCQKFKKNIDKKTIIPKVKWQWEY